MTQCKQCLNEIEIKTRFDKKKKFCNSSCSAKFNNLGKSRPQETREKIRESLKLKNGNKQKPQAECLACNGPFLKRRSSHVYCSRDCMWKFTHRKKTGLISKKTWSKIFERAFPQWKCPYCEWTATFDVHHIKPQRDGRTDHVDNLILLCPNHHSLITRKSWKPNDLSEHCVGQFYGNDEFFSKFYFGTNKPLKL